MLAINCRPITPRIQASMDFDVLVIGSGAGGGMSALSLSQQGFKVGLIERGPRFDPQQDYILNHADWATRHDPLNDARHLEQSIDHSYRTPTPGEQADRYPLNYHRVHGVGGSTLHYQGEAHRFPEHAFTQRSQFGWGTDWPIDYADLRPYYRKAEDLLGVAGAVGNPHKPTRGEFPTPAHTLSARSRLLAKSAQAAGMTLLPNTLALPSQSVDGRLPCQHSGGCNYGCVFGAKSSIDQAILPIAQATGNIKALSDTRVTKLNLDEQGEIQSISCINGEQTQQLSAARYVLATGAVETSRLMLHSKSSQQPHGYANQRDQVGRYFMETVLAYAYLDIHLDFTTYRGPPLDSRIWDFAYPIDQNTNGFVLGSAGFLHPNTSPAMHAVYTHGIGRAHKQAVRDSFGKTLYLFGITEQEPQADNRVSLSTAKDSHGIPKAKIHCSYSERDQHTISVMHKKLALWQQATPNSKISHSSDTLTRSSATHVGGGCRMGNDPNTSVVDAYGKIHRQSNCYITDASVFPTQGAGDSPSLTIQALALRTADKIGQDLKG